MSSFVLKDTQIYMNAFNISGLLSNAVLGYEADLQEDTAFGDSSRSRLPGLLDASITSKGFFDYAEDKELFDQIGNTSRGIFSVAPQTATEGDRAFTLQADVSKYQTFGDIGTIMPFDYEAHTSGALVRGVVGAVGAKVASGNSATFHLGAVPAGGQIVASLHVVAASGTSETLDVTVVSDNDGTFDSVSTTRLTFTQATAVTSEVKSANGAITDQYWRVEWTIADDSAASPSFTIFVVLGVVS